MINEKAVIPAVKKDFLRSSFRYGPGGSVLLYADFGDYPGRGRHERVYAVPRLCSAAGPGINDCSIFCFVYKMEEIINIASLDSSLASLKDQFNSGKEKLRFLALLSPTCPL